MRFKAAIFDLDGTLADTIPLTVFALQETIRKFTGKEMSDEEVLAAFGPIERDILKQFVEKERLDAAEDMYVDLFISSFKKFVTPMNGIRELLAYLDSRDIKIGLFTGRGKRVTEPILKALGMIGYFQVMVTGDVTKNPKPDPEGIQIAMKALKTQPENSIYTGDFDVDILASRAAGTTAVLALWSSTHSEDLRSLKPDQAFKSPFEFIDWLKGLE